jgi:hypothetical protein
MKNVFMLMGAIVISALAIQKLIGKKHIYSREDDPSIPPVATNSF